MRIKTNSIDLNKLTKVIDQNNEGYEIVLYQYTPHVIIVLSMKEHLGNKGYKVNDIYPDTLDAKKQKFVATNFCYCASSFSAYYEYTKRVDMYSFDMMHAFDRYK